MDEKDFVSPLTKRRLQAEVIAPIHAELSAELGVERANAILDRAVKKSAIAEGKAFAAKAPGGRTSMAEFIKLHELWTRDGSLELEVLEASDTVFNFDVTRCKFAETFKAMGLGHIGHLMACNRDGTFCQGYDPKITNQRDNTIMAGAPRCTFRYRYDKDA